MPGELRLPLRTIGVKGKTVALQMGPRKVIDVIFEFAADSEGLIGIAIKGDDRYSITIDYKSLVGIVLQFQAQYPDTACDLLNYHRLKKVSANEVS